MRLTDSLRVHHDTCNVYLLITGTDAVAIDFGSGAVLDHLADHGVERITDVLMTHHHRDQGQGLARAAAAGRPLPPRGEPACQGGWARPALRTFAK